MRDSAGMGQGWQGRMDGELARALEGAPRPAPAGRRERAVIGGDVWTFALRPGAADVDVSQLAATMNDLVREAALP